ncbi:DNA-directed RNA polymerase subunit beta [Eremococcus coleocola]|uniref:DNA-directed RNA polymerase subunit beta n=1 Tax=Eremococcus coleocola ACS-139-V-Col8 TaxID=908337 RepID=E4KP73_9LACT|nr:DNA-directed RNA polymerase subunit beta [Eremococcus coleocola]EFR30972.1 hypothetical protein HMPREF9257_1360 [Eremococcus coleocola ACS-139-V-Col8]
MANDKIALRDSILFPALKTIFKLLIFLLLVCLVFIIGIFVGYILLGGGSIWEVFNQDTWFHIFNFIK